MAESDWKNGGDFDQDQRLRPGMTENASKMTLREADAAVNPLFSLITRRF